MKSVFDVLRTSLNSQCVAIQNLGIHIFLFILNLLFEIIIDSIFTTMNFEFIDCNKIQTNSDENSIENETDPLTTSAGINVPEPVFIREIGVTFIGLLILFCVIIK